MKVLFSIAIVLVIALLLYTYFNVRAPSSPKPEYSPNYTELLKTISKGDLKKCSELKMNIDDCELMIMLQKALAENNPSLCDNIKKSDECRRRYEVSKELKEGCKTDECYYIKAISENDTSKCNMIQSSSLRQNCLNVINPENNDDDIFAEALRTNNPSLCEDISSDNMKSICYSVVG